ncbi:putative histone deacetylase [Helianthus annuus]|nr:putative histone deacetylase [Helianthus annuus]
MGGEGYYVNVPWSRGGVRDNDYIFAFEHIVLPIDSVLSGGGSTPFKHATPKTSLNMVNDFKMAHYLHI